MTMIDDDSAPGTWDMVKMMDTLDISMHKGGKIIPMLRSSMTKVY